MSELCTCVRCVTDARGFACVQVKPNQRVIELLVNRRTTFFDIKQILANEFDVFPGKSPVEWCLSVSCVCMHEHVFVCVRAHAKERIPGEGPT